MSVLARLGITAGVVVGTAVVAAIAIAILDLYLSGHGLAEIRRQTISGSGVELSIADIALLAIVAFAGALTWWVLPRKKAA